MGMAKGKLYEIRYNVKIVVKNNGRNSYKKRKEKKSNTVIQYIILLYWT